MIPKQFCREYYEVKGQGQLINFMAVVLGVKKAMDDWVPKKNLKEFIEICKKYNLLIKKDNIFSNYFNEELKNKAIGKEVLNTTIQQPIPFDDGNDNDFVHVFLAKEPEALSEIYKNGWYPGVIQNRVIDKPFIDHYRFGLSLGYPKCCIDFFIKKNNWMKYNFFYEIYKNSDLEKKHFLCNPFFRNTGMNYCYHMACSFNCQATINYNFKLRELIKSYEPEIVDYIDKKLKQPFLALTEDEIYMFMGEINNKILNYQNVEFVSANPNRKYILDVLSKGNNLQIKEENIEVNQNKQNIQIISCKNQQNRIVKPLLIQFN